MIEFLLLSYLRAFADCGTLTKAAEHLNISQPALTRAMQKLEDELDVTLFNRQKNRISLNDNGLLAAECAKAVLASAEEMTRRVQAFDLAKRTIEIGSSAPAPLQDVLGDIARIYPDRKISSQMAEPDILEKGLADDTFDMVILPYKPEGKEWPYVKLMTEQLYFLLPPSDPLASSKGLYLREMDGRTMLLYSRIGFWRHLTDKKMPHTTFIIQTERNTFQQLVTYSDLSSFGSSYYLKGPDTLNGKAAVPILDPEATVTFYGVCKRGTGWKKLEQFMQTKIFPYA